MMVMKERKGKFFIWEDEWEIYRLSCGALFRSPRGKYKNYSVITDISDSKMNRKL